MGDDLGQGCWREMWERGISVLPSILGVHLETIENPSRPSRPSMCGMSDQDLYGSFNVHQLKQVALASKGTFPRFPDVTESLIQFLIVCDPSMVYSVGGRGLATAIRECSSLTP